MRIQDVIFFCDEDPQVVSVHLGCFGYCFDPLKGVIVFVFLRLFFGVQVIVWLV